MNDRSDDASSPLKPSQRRPQLTAVRASNGPRSALENIPTLALPTGGGALRGIGEKLSVDAATGTASISIPLPLSPGRGDATPDLSLHYDAGAGAGLFGWGWRLTCPRISRRTDKGLPQYLDALHSDTFVLADTEDLVPLLEPDGTARTVADPVHRVTLFAPRNEGAFSRIERWEHPDGDVYWRVRSTHNTTMVFGTGPATRIAQGAQSPRIFAWLLAEIHDDRGNRILFEYKQEDRVGVLDGNLPHEASRRDWTNPQRHLKRVLYGNVRPKGMAGDDRFLFELVFDFGDHTGPHPAAGTNADWPARADAISTRRPGFELRTYRLCRRILMFHRFPNGEEADAELVTSLELAYRETSAMALLEAATPVAHGKFSDGRPLAERGPSLRFTYQQRPDDLDSRPGRVEAADDLPAGFADKAIHWVDIEADGLGGALIELPDRWLFKPNASPLAAEVDGPPRARLGATRVLQNVPNGDLAGGSFLDVEGDGLVDLVHLDDPVPGFDGRNEAGEWIARRPFPQFPTGIDWQSPELRLIDLTGDGRADIVIFRDDQLVWYPSLGAEGYGAERPNRLDLDEERAPRLVFSSATEGIFLADMTGDGLTDLVRVAAREVAYWPNLGYGRFGSKIALSGAPALDADGDFDPRRVRMADTDGSGTTDVVYLGAHGWSVHVNCAGNRFDAPRTWSSAPSYDDLTQVDAFDLLANGTTCLVWSSGNALTGRSIQFLPLAGGHKPYILTGVSNGMGRETTITCAPSTRFFLDDLAAGRPWRTHLPFPVQVVRRIETHDHVSGHRFVSRYAYHHGYYDGREKEFRGFGFVEQWDSESWSNGADAPINEQAAIAVPPVRIRRWYHTGRPGRDGNMSRLYADDFFGARGAPNGAAELLERTRLADVMLPSGLSAQDHRDACRALKGLLLREEIADGDENDPIPYRVSVRAYQVRLEQPGAAGRPAIVFVHERETLDVDLERSLAAPRAAQSFVLEVGAFGDVVAKLAIAHGGPLPAIPGAAASGIDQPRATLDEISLTDPVTEPAAWRKPAPAETRSYALAGVPLSGRWPATVADAKAWQASAAKVEPHETLDPMAAAVTRKLIGHSRTLYRRDDFEGPLQLRQLGALGLPYETYGLAFTPQLLVHLFGDRIPAGALAEAGYRDLDGDGRLWTASGRVHFDRGATHPEDSADAAGRTARATAEKAEAMSHFFLPRSVRDPFGGHAFVDYDANDLFAVASEDRVGNLTRAEYDTRVLQPHRLIDPNGNSAHARFDIWGRSGATAIAGKSADEGDLPPPADVILEAIDIEALLAALADPAHQQQRAAELLGTATSRVITAIHRFEQLGLPGAAVTLQREIHRSDVGDGRIAVTVVFVDGGGRIIQSKVLTDPGPLVPGGAALPTRWTASSWVIHDNKGNPARVYEPFFTGGPGYEPNRRAGVSQLLFRDPLSRVIGVLHPDGSITKTEHASWVQVTWDANDTVLLLDHAADSIIGGHVTRLPAANRPVPWYNQRIGGALGAEAKQAAEATEAHADTPALSYLDALGRAVLAVEDGGPTLGKLTTIVRHDDDGSLAVVIDATGRTVERREHDLLGRTMVLASLDAGTRRHLLTADGLPFLVWDDRGRRHRSTYDAARRPTGRSVTDAAGTRLCEKTVYGEALGPAGNHRGRIHRVYDSAGCATTALYDFKGTPRVLERRLRKDLRGEPNWTGDPHPLLENETFTIHSRQDALGRLVQQTSAVSSRAGAPVSVLQPRYGLSGGLDTVDLWLDLAQPPADMLAPASATRRVVTGIERDAKGQRTAIRYGNGVVSTFSYDPLTYRLSRALTNRGAGFAADRPGEAQNLAYTYDPVGNITHVHDDAQQTIYFLGQAVEPSSHFSYDPLYRLCAAEGREHRATAGTSPPSWNDEARHTAHPADATAMRRYSERYVYDEVGNLLELRHLADAGNWTRLYDYLDPSRLDAAARGNRLTRARIGVESEPFTYDAHGNVASTQRLAAMSYDYADRFVSAELGGGGRVDHAYDASGQRVVKRVERRGAGGIVSSYEERLYFGGFELFRRRDRNGNVILERETLKIADGEKVAAIVETCTIDNAGDDPAPPRLFRHRFDNHLGSCSLELADNGAVISYEEYHPFGSTALRLTRSGTETPNRYRFTGKERDEETGLYYHGARYYAPWLGRWMACDPGGIREDLTLYTYARNNPVTLTDLDGYAPRRARSAATVGDMRPYNRQGAAIRAGGNRLTQHEHISAKVNLQLMTKAPNGVSAYLQGDYRKSVTLTVPRDMAVAKDRLDMRLRDRLKAAQNSGVVNQALIDEMTPEADAARAVAARNQAIAARQARGCAIDDLLVITDSKIDTAVHYQAGQVFEGGKRQPSPAANATASESAGELRVLDDAMQGEAQSGAPAAVARSQAKTPVAEAPTPPPAATAAPTTPAPAEAANAPKPELAAGAKWGMKDAALSVGEKGMFLVAVGEANNHEDAAKSIGLYLLVGRLMRVVPPQVQVLIAGAVAEAVTTYGVYKVVRHTDSGLSEAAAAADPALDQTGRPYVSPKPVTLGSLLGF